MHDINIYNLQKCDRVLTQVFRPMVKGWVPSSGQVNRYHLYARQGTPWLDRTQSCASLMDNGLRTDRRVSTVFKWM